MHKRVFVRDQILDLVGDLRVGDPIPAERQLSAQLGVARATVRNATAELVREGRLERRQGSGTYVAAKGDRRPRIGSFSDEAHGSGQVPTSRTLSAETRAAGAQLGRRLELSPGEPVMVFRRLRLADELPMALETLHVPADLVPGLTATDLEEQSFYKLLSERYRINVRRGVQTIEPTVIDEEESDLLGVPALSPAFLFELTTRGRDGRVVEFVRSVHRGDRFKLSLELESTNRQRYDDQRVDLGSPSIAQSPRLV